MKNQKIFVDTENIVIANILPRLGADVCLTQAVRPVRRRLRLRRVKSRPPACYLAPNPTPNCIRQGLQKCKAGALLLIRQRQEPLPNNRVYTLIDVVLRKIYILS
jgi:hypothetical protein